MTSGKAEIYSVISKCFAPIDRDTWEELTQYVPWSEFLESCRYYLLVEARNPDNDVMPGQEKTCPLQDFLSGGEIDALYKPPSFEEKKRFAAKHFTGGLPSSACPVESLYMKQAQTQKASSLFPQTKGLYLGDPAWYMQALTESLGMNIPEEYHACPDHLAIELDLLAVLERSELSEQARVFFFERFQWLPAYRTRLLQVVDDARFYIGLIDVLIGMYSNQMVLNEVV